MTADVADRCVTYLPGLPCPGALGLIGLSWELPCVPVPPAEVTNPPPWARTTPSDPTDPSSSPATARLPYITNTSPGTNSTPQPSLRPSKPWTPTSSAYRSGGTLPVRRPSSRAGMRF